MIIDGDDFIEKPSETLTRVERFLGIPEFFSPANFVFTGDKNIIIKDCQELNLLKAEKGFPVIKTCPLALKINACPVSRQGF